jgi:hypothetical protein
VGQERLGPSYFFISLVLGPLNSLLWYVPSSRYVYIYGVRLLFFVSSRTNKRHHHLGVQEEQHENELIAKLRGQVDLQHQLLAAEEGCIQQNDVKVAELAARVGFMEGPGASV